MLYVIILLITYSIKSKEAQFIEHLVTCYVHTQRKTCDIFKFLSFQFLLWHLHVQYMSLKIISGHIHELYWAPLLHNSLLSKIKCKTRAPIICNIYCPWNFLLPIKTFRVNFHFIINTVLSGGNVMCLEGSRQRGNGILVRQILMSWGKQ